MSKTDPNAWPRMVAPAIMLTNGRVVSAKPIKFNSYDDMAAERAMGMHGEALQGKKIRGRPITAEDIAGIGYYVDGQWMEATNRGISTVGQMMRARDAGLRKSSGAYDHGEASKIQMSSSGFDPRAPMGGGGGEVQVHGYDRNGSPVRDYTRSRPK